MTFDEIWNAALGEIELSVSKAQFGTWFKGTKILSLKDSSLCIQVSNGFAKEWLENKYNLIIL
ncbi:MAG: chromosomal replication initiator protein DnaA, partial [Candidatus Moranbacteria bacterium]|nr:chromosomal replication initiator protein DnaA [Candidatus Moranbacteria bacterium]